MITYILVLVVALILVYAIYYASKARKRKPAATVVSEPKPQSTSVEPPKVEPVMPIEKPAPPPSPVEALKPEPVQVVAPKTESAVIEAPKAEVKPESEPKPKPVGQAVEKKERGFSVISIEGIGKVYAEKLHTVNIYHTSDLLRIGATPQGRRDLAEKTGISHELILEWVNLADLFRVKGIGEEYSDLLEEAGVDTVVELSHRNAANLHTKMLEVNEAKRLVRRMPSLASVEAWVKEAKTLPRVVEY